LHQISGACVALCAETGALAAFAGYMFTAAVLIGISSAVWTWRFTGDAQSDAGQYSPASQSSPRTLLIALLAVVVTAIGLIPYLRHSYGIRGFGFPSSYQVRQGDRPRDERTQLVREKIPEGSAVPATQGDPGVVLWPEKLIHTKLVAPAPVLGNGVLTGHPSTNPLRIPFDGVYWVFKAPDVSPPGASRQVHGSPDILEIRSTDRRPLSMEAHENLGTVIDLGCCSRIQIAIRNADNYPETVSLELVLINTGAPGKPSQSLGKEMVKSTRPWKVYKEAALPASEILNFVIPKKLSLRRFDEVSIVFRIDAARADAGPKIAIDHLVLIPRGF
jgi:hypothetical protein